MVNWYESSLNVPNAGDVLPTLLRFGGIFNVLDFNLNTEALALFIDHDALSFPFTESYLNNNGNMQTTN